jgi:spore coat protein U-like protein
MKNSIYAFFKVTTRYIMCSALFIAQQTLADSIDGKLTVSSSVIKSCVASVTPLNFGIYSSSANLSARITVIINCTNGTPYYIGVTHGQMSSNGNDKLKYAVYQDVAQSRILGNRVNNNTISGIGTGTVDVITIYALIPSTQSIDSGAYQDTMHVNLFF